MSNNAHDKIIKKAAKEILIPLGMFQKGQSRCWLDDNGWYITQVEFQPSAWSKGAYLNVGVSFLWEKSEALNNTLSFDFGYREKGHVEFNGNEDNFYREMIGLSTYAKEKVLYYRKFKDLNFCKQQLENNVKNSDSLWNKWNMAMFYFFIKDNDCGKNYLKRIIEANDLMNTDIEWVKRMLIKCKELFLSETALTEYVISSIIERRRFFSNKSSYRKLRNWQDFELYK
ncbi:hypothetical protein [Clostridium sp. JNZ J1-5]